MIINTYNLHINLNILYLLYQNNIYYYIPQIFQIIIQQIITQHFKTHPLILYKITFKTKQSYTNSTPLPTFKSHIHLFINNSNKLPTLKLPTNDF